MYERLERMESSFSSPMTQLSWSRSPLRQLTGVEQMMYDDAYTIQLVPQEMVENCFYAAGMVPFMQKLLLEVRKFLTKL